MHRVREAFRLGVRATLESDLSFFLGALFFGCISAISIESFGKGRSNCDCSAGPKRSDVVCLGALRSFLGNADRYR
jgi:hypothetical protein